MLTEFTGGVGIGFNVQNVPETRSQDVSRLPPQQLALPLDVLVPKCNVFTPGFALTSL